MTDETPRKLVSEYDWDRTWTKIFDKYQADLRHAYYIRALRRRREVRVLEIAAGSFRDMAALNRMGVRCEGADFSAESVDLAKVRFPDLAGAIHKMDAFAFEFTDDQFDLTYHNGFWGLFADTEIKALAAEQARISRGRMIATVHNAHNETFKGYFERTAVIDPLFNIRFFDVEEISEIMRAVCPRVTVIPVGKAKKKHEDTLINLGLGTPALLNAYLRLSGHRLLEQSERLLCLGEF